MQLNDSLVLVRDFVNTPEIPTNFRTSRDPFIVGTDHPVTRLGLDTLNVSASRQFSELNLITSLERMSGQVYIVDLRQESHAFADGTSICWYGLLNQANVGKTSEQIEDLERQLACAAALQGNIELNSIVRKSNGRIEQTSSYQTSVHKVETERELVESKGLKYVRLPVTDHQHPAEEIVDDLVELLTDLPDDAWLHLHCRSGKGRSSTFMVLCDIFHNAKEVSLPDIVLRNALLGSKDVSTISDLEAKLWKNGMARKRYEFVSSFYGYMVDPQGFGHLNWSDWLKTRSS